MKKATPLDIFFAKNPFFKLLPPLMAGILLQWYWQYPVKVGLTVIAAGLFVLACWQITSLRQRFFYKWIAAIGWQGVWVGTGMLLVFAADIRHDRDWFAPKIRSGDKLALIIQEYPIEKERSYKAEALVGYILRENNQIKTSGKIIIYFQKDSVAKSLRPGTMLLTTQMPQEINHAGSFDFKRYALFQQITHSVYLAKDAFIITPGNHLTGFQNLLQQSRSYVLATIQRFIKGEKEAGLAEALLIGYKDDIDKNLLQSYINTGVVHIIAVSGMHLALLYWLLNLFFKPLLRSKHTKWLHPVLVLLVLWLFCFITGSAASIVRAAVMFSFITIGKTINRQASVYNTLAASAFVLLCYNPFWLWDVGFQLSYIAVLSIVVFFNPVYQLIFIRNKLLDWLWQLLAVSVAAQVLTTPISVYHFHQFPVYFLATNLLAVPISSITLIGTLLLVLLSFIHPLAEVLGRVLQAVIWWMNSFIESIEQFPHALWQGLQISFAQMLLLFVLITGTSVWWFYKDKKGLWLGLSAAVLFLALRVYSFHESAHQQMVIVYNLPRTTAIDFVEGRHYLAVGDSTLLTDETQQARLMPSRTLFRISPTNALHGLAVKNGHYLFHGKKILLLDDGQPLTDNIVTPEVIIVAGNVRCNDQLSRLRPAQVVIASGTPAGKARYWKAACETMHIPCHEVVDKGAFVMKLH
ncbi:MAG: ComEC/Rec2 family competence protein [Niabella sp.]